MRTVAIAVFESFVVKVCTSFVVTFVVISAACVTFKCVCVTMRAFDVVVGCYTVFANIFVTSTVTGVFASSAFSFLFVAIFQL